MSLSRMNDFGQPVGTPVAGVFPRPRPSRSALPGAFVRLEPLTPDHAPALFEAFAEDRDGRGWTYLPRGPFKDHADAAAWAAQASASEDPLYFAICAPDGTPLGFCSYLRIDPANGAIEVGFIHMSPRLQRTPAATEAMFLMMANAFDTLGYRRYEWKCDALNTPSRRAAQRLGFSYEGTFRQAVIVKGRNRDTAWFSVIDSEWPALKARFEHWLDPANFDADGYQITALGRI
ncbi:GNAT family N-acetyltransferase [Citreicella sp. C3M06]|uniref:GNAT family N-acetyltransferase n=1 Tax=Roseobacteraceae TaxID=2854170 RepID=UPI001C0A4A9D|nr:MULTISPECIES: GNAT family protein [Roseobacteraceae]MBU2960908.1 GNAT family N-acetyltransferase [Citreicella sp. C3M06]MDO6584423.1 GNAT family protein [Salipiger sp. 1_MG-2023]